MLSHILDQVFRREAGRVLATLIRQLGDFDRAEDALQDAIARALERWSNEGIPSNPAAWLTTWPAAARSTLPADASRKPS
jgi:RNA polymerase sigma-70 factor, ECF subfamily